MRLPIPIVTESSIYRDIEISKPKSSVIADTKKMADSGSVFPAIKVFLAGSIMGFMGEDRIIEDKAGIAGMVAKLPYRSAELAAIQILLLYDEEKDAVEGVYSCPRCSTKIVSGIIDVAGVEVDTRDYMSQLNINYMEDDSKALVAINLTEPVIIKNTQTGQELDRIESLVMRHPTLQDCIVAETKYGHKDEVRMQFALYIESLIKVNGKEVDNKYKSNFGMLIFNNIKNVKTDLGSLNTEMSKYGLDPRVEKHCKECDKIWMVPVNTSNFFVSGLAL